MRCSSCGHENPEAQRFCGECGAPLARESAAPASVGDGRYRLERPLGEGSRKRVYVGRDSRLDREVAVAVVKTDGLDDTGRHRITREARAMARLGDHPHIVTVFDVGEDNGTPYIVSELMPGGSVADLIAARPDGRLSVDDGLAIAEQVALALEHAHGLTIVHRDLKPANVWLAADGTARLGDFGLAVDVNVSRMTSEGMVVGTVAYLAPEQAVGRAPDARSDLYALGAMLYELLTGRPPFLGDDAVGVISQHLSTAPVAPSWHNADVPPAVEALVLRLLEKDPGSRPASATEVIAEIRRLRELRPESVATPTDPDDAPRPSAVRAFGRLVGRTVELAQLTGAFDEAASGRGRLLLVAGEPGIGKTRLTEELAVYAGVRGAKTCWGHCFEGELGVPYLPFVEALRAYTRARPDDALRAELGSGAPEMALLVSELRERFPDLPTAPSLVGDAERLRLFEGVAAFLHNAAAEQPIVLMLDDLHWADKPSLLLVQHLARNLRRDRVLIVGTYRDVELDRSHPLADAIASLRREQLFERVLLRGLPAEEVHAFIEAFGDQEPPAEFSATIYRETEGNPFFLTEILRHLAESGTLTRVDGRWVGDVANVAEGLPEGVREVIGRRLDHLSEDCNRMLTVGAAMPGGFEMEVCAAVLALDEDRVLDLLDESLNRQIVRERSGAVGIYEFSHALIRQTLYSELSTPRRVRMHRQIATALEARYGANIDARLGEIAYHCFQGAPGGDIDKAVDYATRAAERASAQAGHEEAARYYEMALQALELADADDRRRAELLLALGGASNRGGDADAADAALREAAELARRLQDGLLFARIALTAASMTFLATQVREDLAALVAEALERLGDGDLALRSRLLNVQAQQSFFFDHERFEILQAESVDLARQSGDPRALSHALIASLMLLIEPEYSEERQAVWDEISEIGNRLGDTGVIISVTNSRMIYAMRTGDRDEYDAQRAIYLRLAEESRSPFRLANAAMERGTAAAIDGDFDAAEQHFFEVLDTGRRLRDATVSNNAGIALLPVWRERGRLDSLVEPTRRVIEGASALDSWRAGFAHMLEQTGDVEGAARILDVVATDGFANVPDDAARPYTFCAAAEAAVGIGDETRCAQLYELLTPRAGTAAMIGTVAYHGAVDRYLGLLALALDRPADAVGHLEAALAIHERMRARPWTARTQYDLGRALLTRGEPGDSERAVALLNQALDTATAVGMTRLVDETLAAKLALQGISSETIMASIDIVAAAVKADRPDLRGQSAADGTVTILFSDIEGYTEMTERLGDTRSQEVLRAHNAILRREIVTHRGNEVKSAGDGFMLAFADVADALTCAIAIQRAISASEVGGERIRIRMGLHTGAVIREADDFFGRTVIVAARVAALARGGEVLATDQVRSATKDDDYTWGPGRETALKGLAGTHQVFAARW